MFMFLQRKRSRLIVSNFNTTMKSNQKKVITNMMLTRKNQTLQLGSHHSKIISQVYLVVVSHQEVTHQMTKRTKSSQYWRHHLAKQCKEKHILTLKRTTLVCKQWTEKPLYLKLITLKMNTSLRQLAIGEEVLTFEEKNKPLLIQRWSKYQNIKPLRQCIDV